MIINNENYLYSINKEPSELEVIEVQLLLEGIYRYYGFDFRDYTFSTIRRRILYRMRTENLTSISALQDKIFHQPETLEKLLADFSINVTEMYRDPVFFLQVREKLVPMLKQLPHIRIWHAGCSTGEEVLSMAILLWEENLLDKTLIYATDLNEKVLEKAKTGTIPVDKMQLYTQNYLEAGGTKSFSEYYRIEDKRAVFAPFLKENIVFAQHNLVSDGSFNEFHLIICRNVLIYFNQALQARVHKLFYDSLCSQGFLGLGSKEDIAKELSCYYHQVAKTENLFQKLK